MIATSGLSKGYGGGRGLFDLDLEVGHGEVFGFLGPNGAGKSTTMRLLLDLIKPTSGSARVLGRDSGKESLEIRRRVGYLPGDWALYPKLIGRFVRTAAAYEVRAIRSREDDLEDIFLRYYPKSPGCWPVIRITLRLRFVGTVSAALGLIGVMAAAAAAAAAVLTFERRDLRA